MRKSALSGPIWPLISNNITERGRVVPDDFKSQAKNAAEIGIESLGLLVGGLGGPGPVPDQFQAPADSPYAICETAVSPQDAVSLWTSGTVDDFADLADLQSGENQKQLDALGDLGDALAPPESAEHAPPDAMLMSGPDGGMDAGMDGGQPAGGFF